MPNVIRHGKLVSINKIQGLKKCVDNRTSLLPTIYVKRNTFKANAVKKII